MNLMYQNLLPLKGILRADEIKFIDTGLYFLYSSIAFNTNYIFFSKNTDNVNFSVSKNQLNIF